MGKVNIELDEEEARIFIELRRIAMKNGSVYLNYDKYGNVKSIDEYKHNELSTLGFAKKNRSAIV